MKIENGPVMWEQIGSAMGNLGIKFLPTYWGLLATLSEFAGGILIVLGLFIRPAVVFMAFTMLIATITHLSVQDQWYNVVTPIEMFSVFIALLFLGAGKYSLDYLFFKRKNVTVTSKLEGKKNEMLMSRI